MRQITTSLNISHPLKSWIVVLFLISGCSRAPEADNPGQCTLSCSGAVIANSNYRSKPLFTPPAISCVGIAAGQSAVLDPVLLMFKVESDDTSPPAPGSKSDSSSNNGPMARRAISIQPVVAGALDPTASEKAGNVTKQADGTYTPTKYIGIATPKEEWCTDSCGVFSVEVVPVCIGGGGGAVTTWATSGAMTAEPASFDVSAN